MERIDIEEIKAKYDLRECWPWYTGRQKWVSNTYLTDRCPEHDDSRPSLLIFENTARCMACGFLADIFTVYQLLNKCSFFEALASLSGKDLSFHTQSARDSLGIVLNAPEPPEPLNPLDVERFEPLGEEAIQCDSLRGLNPDTVERFNLRHDGNGMVVCPVLMHGALVNVKLYDTRYKEKEKRGLQPIKWRPMDVGRGKQPYNADGVKNQPRVVVVESEKDVWYLEQVGVHALASGGAAVWNETHSASLVDADEVYVMGDNDEAGRRFNDRVCKRIRRAVPIYWTHNGIQGLERGYDAADFVRDGGDAVALECMMGLSRKYGGRAVV